MAALLGEFEQVWRGRVARIDALLASDAAEPHPAAPHPDQED